MFGPVVGWSFVGTGLYARQRRPESRTGTLMVLIGFAWFGNAIATLNSPCSYTLGQVTGGLWGGVFLHLVMTFPSGRIANATDRRDRDRRATSIFTLANVPALLVATPADLGCDDCPREPAADRPRRGPAGRRVRVPGGALCGAVRRGADPARPALAARAGARAPAADAGLRERAADVRVVTVAASGGGDSVIWPAFVATALLPFAFLGGLLRSHVARLDAELRASRLRIVQAGDTERRRLERNLHDGAQARLVALALQLGHARRVAGKDPAKVPELLDGAMAELSTSLAELRELARGIHPAVLTEKGLDAALYALAARAPVPVTLDCADDDRLPEAVEVAAYFVVSEALTNVAKYAQASHARHRRAPRERDGHGRRQRRRDRRRGHRPRLGAARASRPGRGARRHAVVESPPGRGTRVRVEIPCR